MLTMIWCQDWAQRQGQQATAQQTCCRATTATVQQLWMLAASPWQHAVGCCYVQLHRCGWAQQQGRQAAAQQICYPVTTATAQQLWTQAASERQHALDGTCGS